MVVMVAYYVVTYDVAEERVNKVRKILKKYFNWVQNSVFEGEITIGKLNQCRYELFKVINKNEDSIYFYEISNRDGNFKIVVGVEKEITDNFL